MLEKRQYLRLPAIAGLIVFAVFHFGCRQRKPIDLPPSLDVTKVADNEMRVLILEASSVDVNFDGSFQAAGQSGNMQTFVKRPVPVKVAFSHGAVSINNINFGKAVNLSRSTGEYIDVGGKRYRGSLNIFAGDDGRLRVVNVLPVEYYLAGVVAAEMPASWEIEALKAQAVAARTYSLYTKFASGANREFDVRSTQADQVYKGVDAENSRIWNVIEQTRGLVLKTSESTVKHNLLPAYFSSTCGGQTVDAAVVFSNKLSPLKGVYCPYCKKTAPAKYYNWDDVVMSKSEIYQKICEKYPNVQSLGGLKTIRVLEYVERGDFYKFTKVELVGTNGKTDWLKGDDLRFILGTTKIRSTACKIEDTGSSIKFHSGRGFGHNVGMCQYGAQAMAREGKNFKEILQFYYPNIIIKGL